MRAKVLVPGNVALQSNRLSDQYIELSMTDTVGDIKIKITLVYTNLDPNSFYIMLNWDKLLDEKITVLQLTQKYGNDL